MSEEMKPCPFCGGSNWRATSEERTCITCSDCGVSVIFDFRFMSQTNWNTRPIEDALKSENERFRKAVNEGIQAAADFAEAVLKRGER
jgi:transcription initiation factor TFIIIB Brf1 subunit/transcription initiation factor TFIIB